MCNPMSAVFSASMWMCGCVDVWCGWEERGGWWMVDGMAAHIPSVTHEVESRQLQGQNVVQGAMRNVEGGQTVVGQCP